MNKDTELLAEAYRKIISEELTDAAKQRDIKLFMGNPRHIVYFMDMNEQHIEMLRRETNNGTRFITVYVKPGKGGDYYYSLTPLSDLSHQDFKDYQPALVPEKDIIK